MLSFLCTVNERLNTINDECKTENSITPRAVEEQLNETEGDDFHSIDSDDADDDQDTINGVHEIDIGNNTPFLRRSTRER